MIRTPICDWHPPPDKLCMKASQLDIWLLNMDTLPCQPDCLDRVETTRLEKFKFQQGRQLYCKSHSAMRAILGRYLNCRAEDVPIIVSPGGKPYINHTPPLLHFNLSHTENIALLAVRSRHEVGVDVEMYRDIPNIRGLSKRTFRDDEVVLLEQSGWDNNLFFEFWTHMEARQKCLGRGVFGESTSQHEVQTHSIEIESSHFGAIAWEAGNAPTLINYYRG